MVKVFCQQCATFVCCRESSSMLLGRREAFLTVFTEPTIMDNWQLAKLSSHSRLSFAHFAELWTNFCGHKSSQSVRFYGHVTAKLHSLTTDDFLFEKKNISPTQTDNSETISTKSEALNWCDGLLLVYSITDRDSFNFIKKLKQELQNSDTPVMLLIGESVPDDWCHAIN